MTGSVEEISLATGKDGKIGHILIPSSPDGVVIEETTVITGKPNHSTITLVGEISVL